MFEFWVDKIFNVLLALLGFSIIRSFLKRLQPGINEHVLDGIIFGVLIIGTIVSWRLEAKNTEVEDFNQLLAQAYSDDRKALDELQTIAEDQTHYFHDRARGAVDGITRSSITFPKDPALVEQLQKFSYAELLQYYRQTPQHGAFVLLAVDSNQKMTEDDKANFLALLIQDDSFRVAQRACLFIRSQLVRYQQVQPTAYERVLLRCQVYGKAWEGMRL